MSADSNAEAAVFMNEPLECVRTHALRALWHAAHGDWNAAHEEAQAGTDRDCAWVHAMLHRDEGDTVNAAYWYRKANKPVFLGSIADERNAIITALLQQQTKS